MTLRGIGRVRGRNLYDAEYWSLKDIHRATVKELTDVPAIGMTLAEDMKRQVHA